MAKDNMRIVVLNQRSGSGTLFFSVLKSGTSSYCSFSCKKHATGLALASLTDALADPHFVESSLR